MSDWEGPWVLNRNGDIMSPNGFTSFTLVRHDLGGMIYFSMKHETGEMADLWKNCGLVKRGTQPLVSDRADIVREWVEDKDGNLPESEYTNSIKNHLLKVTPGTNRLEGELDFHGKKAWVKLFMVRKAVRKDDNSLKDLLVVRYSSEFKASVLSVGAASMSAGGGSTGPIEDGTGHGNSP